MSRVYAISTSVTTAATAESIPLGRYLRTGYIHNTHATATLYYAFGEANNFAALPPGSILNLTEQDTEDDRDIAKTKVKTVWVYGSAAVTGVIVAFSFWGGA